MELGEKRIIYALETSKTRQSGRGDEEGEKNGENWPGKKRKE